MRKRNNKYYVVKDDKRKLFNIIESGNNVQVWDRKIDALKQAGQDYLIGQPSEKLESVIKEDQERLGYVYTKNPVWWPYE